MTAGAPTLIAGAVDLSPAALDAMAAHPRTYSAEVLGNTIRALGERAGILPLTARPAPVGPRCGDCLQVIDPVSHGGHLDWCPFFGYPDFPEAPQ